MRAEALALVALLAPAAACGGTASSPPPPSSPPAVTRAIRVGDKVTPFTGRDVVTGRPLGLEAGKPNLVWFWATWSIDNKAMPHVVALARKHPELHVVLVSVDDEPKGIPEFLSTHANGELSSIWDEAHRIANDHFLVSCAPTFFVVDRGGALRHIECGFHDGAIEDAIEPAVNAAAR